MNRGFITAQYMDHMGSDLSVVNAARASFDAESDWVLHASYADRIWQDKNLQNGQQVCLTESDAKLIRFLASGYRTGEWDSLLDEVIDHARHGGKGEITELLKAFKNKAQHWAPFAHPHVQIRVTMPIFLARQMVKHQVGGTWSEVSRRYVSDDPRFWFPDVWHTRPDDVKQGSGEPVTDQRVCDAFAYRVTAQAEAAYRALLAEGVAPEEARIVLPHNLMTTVVWTGSLLFWARVCNQRLDSHAQLAAQELAKKISAIVQPYFPVSWKELVG